MEEKLVALSLSLVRQSQARYCVKSFTPYLIANREKIDG